MASTQNSVITLSEVSFSWPDGTSAIDEISAAFTLGRAGLIGDNGTGKTTLLRLIRGDLRPTSGTVSTVGDVGYLPQQLTLRTEATIADLLGVRSQLEALRAIETGDPSPQHFETVGDQWDVEARSCAALEKLGLPGLDLDRQVGRLSGGEAVLACLAGLQLADCDIVLLDEPTNNLDRRARHNLYEAISAWKGTLVVVSHDVTLLDLMDHTAELRTGSLRIFGGPYSEYQEQIAAEQAAAEQALRTAEQSLRTEQRQQVQAQTKLARRQRYARTDYRNKRKPKIVMNQRKSEAQVSAGKLRAEHQSQVEAARAAVEEQASRVRSADHIRIALPDPQVPAGRRLAELHDGRGGAFVLQGPERVALIGPNGIGKTRLLQTLTEPETAEGREVYAVPHTDRIGYLPQRLDHLDDDLSILETVRAATPNSPPEAVRAQLARFLFRADVAHRLVGDTSGGERFRVALATLLLADPPNQLLILDEPTNNLDLRSIDELVAALGSYRGGLIVVSHDDAFLDRLSIDTWIAYRPEGLAGGEDHPARRHTDGRYAPAAGGIDGVE